MDSAATISKSFVAEMAKTLGDGVQPRSFRLVPKRVVRIRPVDDLGQQDDGRIAPELVFLHQRIERALLPVMAELDSLYVERNRALTPGNLHHFLGRQEQE